MLECQGQRIAPILNDLALAERTPAWVQVAESAYNAPSCRTSTTGTSPAAMWASPALACNVTVLHDAVTRPRPAGRLTHQRDLRQRSRTDPRRHPAHRDHPPTDPC